MSAWFKLVMHVVQIHTAFGNFLLTHLTLTLIYKKVEFVSIEIKIELCSGNGYLTLTILVKGLIVSILPFGSS